MDEAFPVPVALCVKGHPADVEARRRAAARYADFNVGHIPDIGVRGAGAAGKHLVVEHKCYGVHVQTTPGTGSRGGVADVGHERAMGNTEEGLIRANFGLKERAAGSTAAHSHRTGLGHVAAHPGAYADALRRGHTLRLLISEIYGGVNQASLRFLEELAAMAAEAGDGEAAHYDHGGRPVSFFVYHARAIAGAAMWGHARVLLKLAATRNQRARRLLDAEAGVATDGHAAVRGRARLWAQPQARGVGRGVRRW